MLVFICLHGYQEFSEILLSAIFKFMTPKVILVFSPRHYFHTQAQKSDLWKDLSISLT